MKDGMVLNVTLQLYLRKIRFTFLAVYTLNQSKSIIAKTIQNLDMQRQILNTEA